MEQPSSYHTLEFNNFQTCENLNDRDTFFFVEDDSCILESVDLFTHAQETVQMPPL